MGFLRKGFPLLYWSASRVCSVVRTGHLTLDRPSLGGPFSFLPYTSRSLTIVIVVVVRCVDVAVRCVDVAVTCAVL